MFRLVIGGGAILAAAVFISALRRTRGVWGLSSVAVLFAAVAIEGPDVLSALLNARQIGIDPVTGDSQLIPSPWVESLLRWSLRICIIAGLAVFLRKSTWAHTRLGGPALAAFVLTILTASFGLLNGSGTTTAEWALVGLVLAGVLLPGGPGAAMAAATVGVTTALLSGMMTLFGLGGTTFICNHKCGIFNNLYIGALQNGNILGLTLVSTLPFVMIMISGVRGVILSAYMSVMILAAGSRSSEIGLVACAVVGLLIIPGMRRQKRGPFFGLAAATLVAGSLASAALPYGDWQPDDFTWRGSIWIVARENMQLSNPFGAGAKGFPKLYSDSGQLKFLAQSLHNQWLDVSYISGLLGMFLFILILWMLIHQDWVLGSGAVLLILTPIMFGGTLERIWNFGEADQLTFTLMAALLYRPVTAPQERPTNTAPSADGALVAGRSKRLGGVFPA